MPKNTNKTEKKKKKKKNGTNFDLTTDLKFKIRISQLIDKILLK